LLFPCFFQPAHGLAELAQAAADGASAFRELARLEQKQDHKQK